MSADRPEEAGDQRIYDAYIAGRQSAALAAGVRAGIFDALASQPLTPEQLARQLGLRPRPVRILARTLVAMGLLRRGPRGLELADDAAAYLVRGKPGWLGGLIDLEVESFLDPARLLAALRADRASVYDGVDPWQRHAEDAESAAAFTTAMHSISEAPAQALARTLDLSGVKRVLDVGGGSGVVSIALARARPGLLCTVWEIGTVRALAQEFIAAAGLASRVSTLEGDFWEDPFPPGHDAVLFSQILHDWPPAKGRLLLEKAHAALPRGGQVWIHEKLIAEDGSGPLANALVDLDMLVWTEGQQLTEEDLRGLLESAGFHSIERRATRGYWSVVLARS